MMTTAVKTATATVTIALLVATVAADTNDLHAVGGKLAPFKYYNSFIYIYTQSKYIPPPEEYNYLLA